jgi:hypothetical protein
MNALEYYITENAYVESKSQTFMCPFPKNEKLLKLLEKWNDLIDRIAGVYIPLSEISFNFGGLYNVLINYMDYKNKLISFSATHIPNMKNWKFKKMLFLYEIETIEVRDTLSEAGVRICKTPGRTILFFKPIKEK